MNGEWAVGARVVAAVVMLPLGGVAARLAVGGVLALLLAAWVPAPAAVTPLGLAAEAGLGAAMGLLAALPAHAASAVRGGGPASLGFAGRVWAWAVFFGMGGPAMLLLALGESFRAVPVAAWPRIEDLVAAGGLLFHAVLVLGLPAWLTTLIIAPLAGLADRVGRVGVGAALLPALGAALPPVLLAALLPFVLDQLRGYWFAALGGAGR